MNSATLPVVPTPPEAEFSFDIRVSPDFGPLTRAVGHASNVMPCHPLGKSPLVSVVMTTFNSAAFVEQAIRSLIEQTYWNLEIIVVDDVSTDATRDIVEEMARRDGRIRLTTFGANRGTYWAKNFGVMASSGEVVTFMDSDDISHPDRIAEQLAVLRRPGCFVTTCLYQKRYEDGTVVPQKRYAFISQMVRRELFDAVGYFDCVRTSADDEFLLRIKSVFGKSCHLNVDKFLYEALVRGESLSNHKDNPKFSAETGGLSPARKNYILSCGAWHSAVAAAGRQPYSPFPMVRRPFSVDAKLWVDPAGRLQDERITALIDARDCTAGQVAAAVSIARGTADTVVVIGAGDPPGDHEGVQWRAAAAGSSAFDGVAVPRGYVLTMNAAIAYSHRYLETQLAWIELLGRGGLVGLTSDRDEGPSAAGPIARAGRLLTGTLGFHTDVLARADSEFSIAMADLQQSVMFTVPRLATMLRRPARNRGASQETLVRVATPERDALVSETLENRIQVLGPAWPPAVLSGRKRVAPGAVAAVVSAPAADVARMAAASPATVAGETGTVSPSPLDYARNAEPAKTDVAPPRRSVPSRLARFAIVTLRLMRDMLLIGASVWNIVEKAFLACSVVLALLVLLTMSAPLGIPAAVTLALLTGFFGTVATFLARRMRLVASRPFGVASARERLADALRIWRAEWSQLRRPVTFDPVAAMPQASMAIAPPVPVPSVSAQPVGTVTAAPQAHAGKSVRELFLSSALPALRAGNPDKALSAWILACTSAPTRHDEERARSIVTAALMAVTGQIARARAVAVTIAPGGRDVGGIDGILAALLDLRDGAGANAVLGALLLIDAPASENTDRGSATGTR